ncbi:type II toxin-antitoxin system RelE/ParE family toxin [Mesorhizobium sp. B261B1A]|uniref:type II toxin-antitoxin system RelE/ParE family toxin n=1 Tax=Mesorhizobium sp. B261B1A TaxID=2876671 RepID=UPI001CD11A2B|nr:type II toxin-antitoxin system RelE/ParE family toxin [Mesorhizobium sp. B261B1A]MCA0058038.1 type II toxin-antitoxin system RelE/ParE family toxin [Mesorhizobium sp. B261B1A]
MKVRFARKIDALVETDQANSTCLPASVIASVRSKLLFIRAAKDERDLRQWASLRFKRLKGDTNECAIRLNEQYRMHFTLDSSCQPNEIEVTFIGDPH